MKAKLLTLKTLVHFARYPPEKFHLLLVKMGAGDYPSDNKD